MRDLHERSQGSVPLLNVKALAALRAVISEGSVTAAAARLHRTQPVVSRLIRQLEASLGLPLFRREKQRLIPTAECLAFYREAERAFATLDEIEASARNIREQRAAPLRILAQSHLAHTLLNVALGPFCAKHRDFRFSLELRQREYISHWIANREFDVGFAPAPMEHPQLQAEALLRAPLYVALPKKHRLAKRPALRVADLIAEPLIALRPGTPLRNRLDALFGVNAQKLNIRGDTATVLSACQLVEQGIGLTLTDPFSASMFLRSPRLVIRRLQPAVAMDYLVLRRRGEELSGLTNELIAAVRAASERLADRVARRAAS